MISYLAEYHMKIAIFPSISLSLYQIVTTINKLSNNTAAGFVLVVLYIQIRYRHYHPHERRLGSGAGA